MGNPSGRDFNQPINTKFQLPNQLARSVGRQTSLSLVSSDAHAALDIQEPGSNSELVRESPSESASSRDTWPAENNHSEDMGMKKVEEKVEESNCNKHSVIQRLSSAKKITLVDVAREQIDIIAEQMKSLPEEFLDELKSDLRVILEGTGGSRSREELLLLQKLVQCRTDLTPKSLLVVHQAQLEILVAINTGIQAFLHPSIILPQTYIIEVFLYKRCRNIACKNQLPADDCMCEKCSSRKGFCSLCMCLICSKFDFEVNTCRWIGCDSCFHWTHTDCAIRAGQVGMGSNDKKGACSAEMFFRCKACNKLFELFGWVKDVFQQCAPSWDREAMVKELDFVSRIFRGSDDLRGRKLYWQCEELIVNMNNGVGDFGDSAASKMIMFLQELEAEPWKNLETEEVGRLIAPQEACSKITEVVEEAVRKMAMVAEEKLRMLKKASLVFEACDHELEVKSREVEELQMVIQQKKQHIEDLESIVRLKQAEADMFQLKANEAKSDAERLQRIALAKSEKAEEHYTTSYLKQRMNEAEAEKQYLFEKMKLQDSSWVASQSSGCRDNKSEMLMLCTIQDLLKNIHNAPKLKLEGKLKGQNSLDAVP